MVLNSLIAGILAKQRRCSVTEVAIYENVGQGCGNGTIALDLSEKTIEGKKKKLDRLVSLWRKWSKLCIFLLDVELLVRCGTIGADVVGWVVPYGRRL
ncbi:hypothetical protein AVEN_209428-1 [Araneus ventricosus]|uniref:Uncharacterized protein n=1 Tax=Araneus ventricosus TaxID=182803 RepID=A0A4Y2LFP5_ARAVE|nr:hypothetical protein AVEN_209428-1 [Araneus ventricosus]